MKLLRTGALRAGAFRLVLLAAGAAFSFMPRSSAASAEAISLAISLDAPNAAAIRKGLVASLPDGARVADEARFRARLAQSGRKKRPPGEDAEAWRIDRLRSAARDVGATTAISIHVRKDRKHRWADVSVVDVATGTVGAEKVTLAGGSRDADADAIAHAVQRLLPPPSPGPERQEASDGGAPESPSEPATAVSAAARAPPLRSSEPVPATGPPPRHEGEGLSAARSLVELSLTGQAAWRRFAYANGITGAARVQTNVPFPGVALAGAVFPLAWTGTAWGDFGLTAEYDRLFLPTNTVNGFASDLSPTSYAAGLRARVHPGRNPRVVVVASASYAVTTFGPVGPETSDLPQVIYRALRPGLDLRVQLGVVSLTAAAGFRWIVDPSAISTRFYAPRGYGADGEVGAGVVVASRLILTLSLGYERYAFDFTAPSETALGAGGALDQILRAGLAATALF